MKNLKVWAIVDRETGKVTEVFLRKAQAEEVLAEFYLTKRYIIAKFVPVVSPAWSR